MDTAIRLVNSTFTVYMLLVLLRWVAGWLELDLYAGRLRWIPQLTDPLVSRLRKLLPPTGPLDLAPPIAVLLLWVARELTVAILIGTFYPTPGT